MRRWFATYYICAGGLLHCIHHIISPLTASHLLHATCHSPLATHRSTLTTHRSLLSTHDSGLTTRYAPRTTHYPPRATHHAPHATHSIIRSHCAVCNTHGVPRIVYHVLAMRSQVVADDAELRLIEMRLIEMSSNMWLRPLHALTSKRRGRINAAKVVVVVQRRTWRIR